MPTLAGYENAGQMSYTGRRGHFVKMGVPSGSGISYTDLQLPSTGQNLSFDHIDSVDRTKLLRCSDSTQLMNTTMIRAYLDFISDSSGVTLGSGGFVAFCPADGYFWLAPSCRSNSTLCIPYFLRESDRAVDFLEVMQKASHLM